MSEHADSRRRREATGAGSDGVGAGRTDALSAEVLFAGRQEVRLLYEGQEYRLRITRNRKLILTK